MIHAHDAAQNSISKVHVRDSSNALVDLSAFRVRDAKGLNDLLATLKASGPVEVDGFGYSIKPIQVTTQLAAVAVTGGTAPYSYSWSIGAGWSATAPSGSSSAFRSPTLTSGETQSITATCTVTDADGNTATVSVLAVCTNNN